MCSGLAVVILGLVTALNDGAGCHGRLGRVARLRGIARLRRIARLGGIARLGRRGRIAPDHGALGHTVTALHDLGLDVALLDLGLDDGRRVDDGGRVGQLRLSFFLVLLV